MDLFEVFLKNIITFPLYWLVVLVVFMLNLWLWKKFFSLAQSNQNVLAMGYIVLIILMVYVMHVWGIYIVYSDAFLEKSLGSQENAIKQGVPAIGVILFLAPVLYRAIKEMLEDMGK